MNPIVTLTMNPCIDKNTRLDRVIPERKLRCAMDALILEAVRFGVAAGIKVIMVTCDQAVTARNIAAMGRRGTQVAKEAADMILKDDAFETILVAVEQGRAIFHNIRRFILYLLSGNVAEIMIVAAALIMGFPLPILPLQILYLNLIGDVFPALAGLQTD